MSYIILDRDGVININSAEYIKTPDEWRAIPGALDAIAQLNRAGFKILIATNQSGVARGYYDIDTLDAIHEKMMNELASVGGYIEEIFFCPHHPDEACECRKPNPGMLQQIAAKYPIIFTETYFIGDSYVDFKAAQAVGCKPLLVLTGNGLKEQAKHPELLAIPSFPDLTRAVEYVISQSGSQHG